MATIAIGAALWAPIGVADGSNAAVPRAPLPDRVVARVYFPDRATVNRLASYLDVFEVRRDSGYLVAMMRREQYEALLKSGYRAEVDEAYTARVNQPHLNAIGGYPCYRTVEETYADLARLASNYPGIAEWIDIGDSWNKIHLGGTAGYDLYVLKLSNKAIPGPKPAFFLMGSVHAREMTTAETATRFAELLASRYGYDADITWILDHNEVHILPQANPDGRKIAETGAYQRKNTDYDAGGGCDYDEEYGGVDLNRNSSFKWGIGDVSYDPCDEMYLGPAAASEPEIQAFQSYATNLFPDQRGTNNTDAASTNTSGVFITLHSYGNVAMYAWGWGNVRPPNEPALQTLGRKFGYLNRYEAYSATNFYYLVSGANDDWLYGERGIASYTFEMGDDFFDSCSFFSNNVIRSNLVALLYAAKAARLPYRTPAGPDIVNQSVSLSTVASGGVFRLTATANDTRYFSNGHGTETSQNIAGARYSIDRPSWATGAVVVAMSPTDGLFNASVEGVYADIAATNVPLGRRLIFIESQDAAGNWGPPSAVFIEVGGPHVEAPPQTSTNIVLQWLSLTNTLYRVSRATNLWDNGADPFESVTSGIAANPAGMNTFTDRWGTVFPRYYRISAYPP